jgi:hypothetical protein
LFGRLTAPISAIFAKIGSLATLVVKVAGIDVAINAIAQFAVTVAGFFSRLAGTVGSALNTAWDEIKRAALVTALAIVEPFSHLPFGLGSWAQKAKTSIQAQLDNIDLRKAARNVEAWGSELKLSATKAGGQAADGLKSAAPKVATASTGLVAAAKGPLGTLAAAGYAAGAGMGAGVGRGILAQIAPTIAAGVALVDQTILAMRTAAAAKSPSKKTAALGEDMGTGLIKGFTSVMATRGGEFAKPIVEGISKMNSVLKTLGPGLTKTLIAAFSKATDAGKDVAVKGMGNAAGAIVAAAKKAGVDARAALAVAMTEGGTSFGAVGDKGTSFGPFQLRIGGASPFADPAKAKAFANSIEGITYAINKMAEAGAKGKVGFDAIAAIVKNFERPADVSGQIKKAMEFYKNIPVEAANAITAGTKTVTAAQLQQLVAIGEIVQTGAKTIGLEHARQVIAGMFEGSPGIVAQARKAMADAVAAAKQAVVDAKAGLQSAFRQLATDALAAFDAVTAAWHPPILDVLAGLRAEDAADALQKTVDEAAQAVKDARAKLVADQAAGPQPGELPEDYQKRIDEDNAAIDRAVLAQGAATRAQLEANMELQGAEEQRQWEERRGRIRENLAADLIAIEEGLEKIHGEKGAYAKSTRKIIALMKRYHIPMKEAGKELASKFSDGLAEGIAEVVKQARILADALEKIPGVTKPKGGNDGTDNTERGRPPDVGSNQRGTSAMNVTVNMPNYLGDKREAAQAIRQELQRIGRDNAVNPLAI